MRRVRLPIGISSPLGFQVQAAAETQRHRHVCPLLLLVLVLLLLGGLLLLLGLRRLLLLLLRLLWLLRLLPPAVVVGVVELADPLLAARLERRRVGLRSTRATFMTRDVTPARIKPPPLKATGEGSEHLRCYRRRPD